MNVYDFDKTIYKGDSTVDFFLFALKRHPSLLRCLPAQAAAFCRYAVGRIDKTELKRRFFCFLPYIDAPAMAEDFWDKGQRKIHGWYLSQQKADDIVISASPEFLLAPVCRRLGVLRLIASRIDCKTGAFTGKNCRGEEKVRRLKQEFGVSHIDSFYSDSVSDFPLAQIADHAFLVRKGKVETWNIKKMTRTEQR